MNNMRNKILSLLVLLLTAATGAWAQSNGTYSDLTAEIGSGGYITLSHDYYKYESGDPIEISTSNSVIDGKGAIIDMEGANISHVFYISADNVTIKNLSIINYTGTDDAIYFSGSGGSVYNTGYDVALSPGTSANTWTLSMPASDVLLTPQYATVAKWAVESAGNPEEKTLLPAAAEGVIAGTTAPLIVEGTVATTTIGETTKAQGTVKYAVTETKTSVPALTAFSATVPTAAKYDDAKTVYVWYYIEGIDADTEHGETRTAQNTFDNSDICTEPLEVSVLTNKFTLTLDPAPVEKVTVTIGDATVTDATQLQAGKIPNVQMGKTVKLAPNTGYKLRKVEVNKTIPKPAATVINPPTLPYIGFKLGFATMALVDAGEADGGTMKYKVTDTDTTPASTDGFSATLPRATDITAPGTYYLWYFVEGDADHSDSEIEFIGIVGALLE
jgi:hypothetical protein